ncbi:hypothetical protein [Brachybacterium saurashtrense]|uniref:Uncharacterized protein n=1 Tax=Brachybacterium saurashtrense TaxID=556288 RepID=A0A345YK52_9MICO|nr:hypothetical protein [Brachybacterium saurashtrense]AXK44304.1 hypothetical protein DWV08_00805 [Brachybacterium saurashtrense]RRR21340.1 hypothetical protein DXU92_14705 [Brachybacterium saurashtrense]RRR22915.1 hypothetical protein DXU92_05935 [Brachybacterium saurashtrense]
MRLRSVIAMHTVHRMQAFGWPLIVGALSLAVVLAVGAIVGSQGPQAQAGLREGMVWSGAIFALIGPMIGYGFTSMGQYFPLALGLGLTRREFGAGVTVVFLANAAFYAVLITLGKIIEVATDGFGLHIRFFDVVYTGTGPAWQTLVQTFLLILAVLFLGAAITAAHLRFGQSFLWSAGALLAVLGVAILAGVIYVDGFGSALLELLTMGWGAWMVVVAAIGAAAASAWLVLVRRTQVR